MRGNILTILEKRKERTRPNSGLVEVLLENILDSQNGVLESVSTFFRIRFICTCI